MGQFDQRSSCLPSCVRLTPGVALAQGPADGRQGRPEKEAAETAADRVLPRQGRAGCLRRGMQRMDRGGRHDRPGGAAALSRAAPAAGQTQAADLLSFSRRLGGGGDRDRAADACARDDGGRGANHPAGLRSRAERESACDALKRSGRELPAELRTVRTLCNSSCVYALIGAAAREVAAGVRLGVHALASPRSQQRQMNRAAERAPARQGCGAQARATSGSSSYMTAMGIDRALFQAAAAIEHERVRYLTRDEIARFGIDAANSTRAAGPRRGVGRRAVVKFGRAARQPKQYRVMKFCSPAAAPVSSRWDSPATRPGGPASTAVAAPQANHVVAGPGQPTVTTASRWKSGSRASRSRFSRSAARRRDRDHRGARPRGARQAVADQARDRRAEEAIEAPAGRCRRSRRRRLASDQARGCRAVTCLRKLRRWRWVRPTMPQA